MCKTNEKYQNIKFGIGINISFNSINLIEIQIKIIRRIKLALPYSNYFILIF